MSSGIANIVIFLPPTKMGWIAMQNKTFLEICLTKKKKHFDIEYKMFKVKSSRELCIYRVSLPNRDYGTSKKMHYAKFRLVGL